MDPMGERIKALRIERDMTQEELAKKIGVQKSTIAKYETGRVSNLKRSTIQKIVEIFEVSPSYLMGFTYYRNHELAQKNYFTIPIYDHIAAGIPLYAIKDIVDQEELSTDFFRESKDEYFGLRIKDHSMEPRICDGDTVIVHSQGGRKTIRP